MQEKSSQAKNRSLFKSQVSSVTPNQKQRDYSLIPKPQHWATLRLGRASNSLEAYLVLKRLVKLQRKVGRCLVLQQLVAYLDRNQRQAGGCSATRDLPKKEMLGVVFSAVVSQLEACLGHQSNLLLAVS